MPVLEPTDPIFAGIPENFRFESVLPSSAVLDGAAVSNVFGKIKVDRFGADSVQNLDALGAQIGKATATSVGWPGAQIDSLGAVVATAFEYVPSSAIDFVLETGFGELPDLLHEIQGALSSALTGVPILGWAINLAQFVFQLVEIARGRAHADLATTQALAYNRDADNDTVRYYLGEHVAGGADWTSMFSPPEPGLAVSGWSSKTVAYTASGAADGFAWGQIGRPEGEGEGFVPGVAQIAGYWQSPRKVPGSERPASIGEIVAYNQLIPASTALAGLLWTNSQKPGPTLGAVDLGAVADAWGQYGDALEAFASSQEGQIVGQIRNSWTWYVPELNDRPLYGVRPDEVPKKWRANRLENLVAYQLDRARKRISKNLGTIACAYVGPDAPALADSELRARWSEMRARLLGHSARANVDLELVPDPEYRSALSAAQKSPSAALTSTPSPKLLTFGVTMEGDPADEPDPPALPGAGPQRVGGGDGDSELGTGLLVAVLLFLWSRRRS